MSLSSDVEDWQPSALAAYKLLCKTKLEDNYTHVRFYVKVITRNFNNTKCTTRKPGRKEKNS